MNTKPTLSMRSIWTNPIHFVACGFGAGAIPVMPGTFGTVVAIPILLLLNYLPLWLYAGIVLAVLWLGQWLAGITCRDFGVNDHPAVVIDEIVGYLITMFAIKLTGYTIILGFILFRIFDIIKPWPIRVIDKKFTGGWAVMLDDVVAGIMSAVVLFLIIR